MSSPRPNSEPHVGIAARIDPGNDCVSMTRQSIRMLDIRSYVRAHQHGRGTDPADTEDALVLQGRTTCF